MNNNTIKIFLSGSVKKGRLDTRDELNFWSNDDIKFLSDNLKFNVSIHNPNELEIDLTDSRARFITDFKELLSSDLVLVNAVTKKGIGVGAEMFFARYSKIPVYTISPLESYYHKMKSFGKEWIHPFIYELSNCIFYSISECVDYLNKMWDRGKILENKLTEYQIQDIVDNLLAFDAGYDDGYRFTKNFWGENPAQYVKKAVELITKKSSVDLKCIDLGCGHGKNAMFVQMHGFDVTAVDCSYYSIEQARNISSDVKWEVEDIRKLKLLYDNYDLVILTGSLHCLDNKEQIVGVIREAQKSTKMGGYNVLSAFNNRKQNLSGHSESFVPCLLNHQEYIDLYSGWELIESTDNDLDDIHPNTNINHVHSITRLLAKKI